MIYRLDPLYSTRCCSFSPPLPILYELFIRSTARNRSCHSRVINYEIKQIRVILKEKKRGNVSRVRDTLVLIRRRETKASQEQQHEPLAYKRRAFIRSLAGMASFALFIR